MTFDKFIGEGRKIFRASEFVFLFSAEMRNGGESFEESEN
jgi:chromosome condensin MukBEF MukE localization factor